MDGQQIRPRSVSTSAEALISQITYPHKKFDNRPRRGAWSFDKDSSDDICHPCSLSCCVVFCSTTYFLETVTFV